MLNEAATTPHLLAYLWAKYQEWLAEQHAERRKEGQRLVSLDKALERVPATAFLKWATEFLEENRCVEAIFVDANQGIRLSNLDIVTVCPAVAEEGSMQDLDVSVPITEGKSRPGAHGIAQSRGAIPI